MKDVNLLMDKLEKNSGKIFDYSDIIKLIWNIFWDVLIQKNKIHKVIFLLKSKWYIYDLKKQLYVAKKPDIIISENDILQKYYRQLLKKHCELYCQKNWYISWYKALELRNDNYEIPTEIYITNALKTSIETVIFDYKIWFKKYSNKIYSDLWYFKNLQKFTNNITISNKKFAIASIELSILESLFSPDPSTLQFVNENIKKALKKYKKTLDFEKISNIVKLGKYHTSLNRLYILSKNVDLSMSQTIYNIIKKYSYV